jgi:hypothetical protein
LLHGDVKIAKDTPKSRLCGAKRLRQAVANGSDVEEEKLFFLTLPLPDTHCNHVTGLVVLKSNYSKLI